MNFGGAIRLNKTGLGILTVLVLIGFLYVFKEHSSCVEHEVRINLKELLKVGIKAAENGGVEVVATRNDLNIKSKGLTKEGLQDSVTTADYLSHCSMLETFKHHFKSVKIISEEAKTECDSNQKVDFVINSSLDKELPDFWVDESDVVVWIDPLDATKEYTEKLYEYVTTMVCVSVKGKPVIGIIHKPFSKKTSWAWTEKSKSPDLTTLDRKDEELKIVISRSHSGEIRSVLDKVLDKYTLIEAAGAGYKALEVVYGHVDAYLHITAIKKWDICAGNAILNAVGGNMTTKFNEQIDYSAEGDPKNEKGLVATMKNHDLFIGKL